MDKLQSHNFFDVINKKRREFWLFEDVVNRNRSDLKLIDTDVFCKMAEDMGDKKKNEG